MCKRGEKNVFWATLQTPRRDWTGRVRSRGGGGWGAEGVAGEGGKGGGGGGEERGGRGGGGGGGGWGRVLGVVGVFKWVKVGVGSTNRGSLHIAAPLPPLAAPAVSTLHPSALQIRPAAPQLPPLTHTHTHTHTHMDACDNNAQRYTQILSDPVKPLKSSWGHLNGIKRLFANLIHQFRCLHFTCCSKNRINQRRVLFKYSNIKTSHRSNWSFSHEL